MTPPSESWPVPRTPSRRPSAGTPHPIGRAPAPDVGTPCGAASSTSCFVHVHPYVDGNGRIGQLLMNLMLTAAGYPWTIVLVERRDAYMTALEEADDDREVTRGSWLRLAAEKRFVLFCGLWYRARMSILILQRNLQFLYEEQLARIEARALGCERWDRDEDNPWRVGVQVNGAAHDVLRRAAYVGKLDDEPTVYEQLIRPKYQGGAFNRTRSVNQYLTHWIYPYRGKYHPQMVRALLNIVGAKPGSRILDPYLGSGTTALEASLLGIDCVGVDISPLCVLLTRVKTRSVEAVAEIRDRVHALLELDTLDPSDASIASDGNAIVADFVEIARMTTLSDVSRRNRDGRTWLRRNLLAMLESVEAHARALSTFEIDPGHVSADLGDARDLGAAGIEQATVDAVVTSPPYSIALDYVKNDEHALEEVLSKVVDRA